MIFGDYNSSIDLTEISIGGMYLIGLIYVLEILLKMSKDLNNQKNDEVRLVVSHFSGYLCYGKMILQ